MSLADFVILTSLVVFSLILAVYAKPNRSSVLLALSVIALASSLAAISSGRDAALPALVVSALFLCASVSSMLLNSENRIRPVLGTFALLISVIAVSPLLLFTSQITFPGLEGSYSAGVRVAEVWDSERGNAWNTVDDPPRRILVRVWYPAEPAKDNASNHRMTKEERAAARALSSSGIDLIKLFREGLANMNTHAFWDAPPAGGEFPLLVYSHGYGGNVAANAMLMEQLASQGYVVFSISHPGESTALVYPDGEFMAQSPERAELMEEHAATRIFEAFGYDLAARMEWVVNVFEPIRIVQERLPVWAEDFRSVVDALERGDFKGNISDVLAIANFDAIGYLGMSAGGGSGPAACHADIRCDASVALDGGLGLAHMRNTNIRVPLMIFDGGFPHRLGGQDLYYEKHSEFGRNPHVYRIVFPENGHSDFTDMALALSPLGKKILPPVMPVMGPVDGRETLLAQSRLVTAFFNIYLKQREEEQFPEKILNLTQIARLVDPEPFRAWVKSGK